MTLYGIADIWLGSLKADQESANPDDVTHLDSGGVDTSRWGMKGSEYLGGGLKAIFTLEASMDINRYRRFHRFRPSKG
ncbi:porin [Rhodoferax sp.]|uniref:porin n=1 Tax=Rhodoferax sp. TaxID=50421 RepID=UPI003BB80727